MELYSHNTILRNIYQRNIATIRLKRFPHNPDDLSDLELIDGHVELQFLILSCTSSNEEIIHR